MVKNAYSTMCWMLKNGKTDEFLNTLARCLGLRYEENIKSIIYDGKPKIVSTFSIDKRIEIIQYKVGTREYEEPKIIKTSNVSNKNLSNVIDDIVRCLDMSEEIEDDVIEKAIYRLGVYEIDRGKKDTLYVFDTGTLVLINDRYMSVYIERADKYCKIVKFCKTKKQLKLIVELIGRCEDKKLT